MSTTSCGSLLAGEELAVGGSDKAPPKSILPILARSRYQIILMNSSITVGAKKGISEQPGCQVADSRRTRQ